MFSLLSGANSQRFGRYPWSRDGRWFSLQEVDQAGESVRVVDLTDRDSAWTWDNGSVQEGAFSALTDRLLCILPDELVWLRFPRGTRRRPAQATIWCQRFEEPDLASNCHRGGQRRRLLPGHG